jgi:hypothetical protein
VDTWADLRLGLEATAVRAASTGLRLLVLVGVFLALALLAWAAKVFRSSAAG